MKEKDVLFEEETIKKNRKKSTIRQKFPVIFPMLVLLVLVLAFALTENLFEKAKIGLVEVEGVILSSEEIISELKAHNSNPSVKGIILRINSPGGAVAPSQEIYTELLRIKENKKVYASISSVAASGGYYIAVGTEKIFSNPGSITGSIGVIMQTFNLSGLMKTMGVESVVVKSAENKDIGSSFRKMTPEERVLIKSVIDDTLEQFIQAITQNRKLSRSEVEKLADGRIFTGRQAKEKGLVDELASYQEVLKEIKKDLGLTEAQVVSAKKTTDSFIWELLNKTKLKNWIQSNFLQSGLYAIDPWL